MTEVQSSGSIRSIEGTFTRKSPASFAEKIGIPMGWFVISHLWMPDKAGRRRAHGRWYKISCDTGTIYRVLRFSPKLKRNPDQGAEIVLDWVGWLDLKNYDENMDSPLKLRITAVPKWQTPLMAIHHPDPIFRLAGLLALLSVGLGALSVVVAFVV